MKRYILWSGNGKHPASRRETARSILEKRHQNLAAKEKQYNGRFIAK
jgi:hypothetical protein